ncbi:MAG: nicotinate-nucleotide adenylyltransferase [Pseudomonadales bacterium]
MHILFGGSFDPIHTGHLATAEAVRVALHAKQAALLPAARSPLKSAGTADHHRLAMLRCAIQDYSALTIDERELRRPPPSYTVDTLCEIRGELGEQVPLIWILGTDALAGLAQWKAWQSLLQLAHLVVIDRPDLPSQPSAEVAAWLATQTRAEQPDQLQCRAHGLWLRMALPPQPFSSTSIRKQLTQRSAQSHKPDGLPARVWQYILNHQLYASDEIQNIP